ncbi:MAG: class I SAM-dependent DNA methyltransferase [Hyphomonadaceae bacterium]|nr:class I SAM-dependent DNA methyltransferase [Hyphomonadaceae bacterium]
MGDAKSLVSKVWNYADILRDAGVSYADYLEQITCLLFLKMDQEREELLNAPSMIAPKYRWKAIKGQRGEELIRLYGEALDKLSRADGLVGAIFLKAQNRVQEPAKLQRLIDLIDEEQWLGLPVDVKGDIYEGLLERTVSEVKSGAGQYFTPRPLIDAIVQVVDPAPGKTVCDPACGTGGFLLSAYEQMRKRPEARQAHIGKKIREETFYGVDIVPGVVRLANMNLYLHGIGDTAPLVSQGDALLKHDGRYFDYVLANPPFGRKQSFRVFTEEGGIDTEREIYERDDFKVTTSNKQLNFLQHIVSILKENGTAAVVLPDNVLFEAGAGERIRDQLLTKCDFHTLLRLPTGIFYKQGVKANVLFFDKKPAQEQPWTQSLWVYDFRTNQRFTLKERPLRREHLEDFVSVAKLSNRAKRKETECFRQFSADDLRKRDKLSLDFFWLKDADADDAESLPPPDELAAEIVESLEAALERFRGVAARLNQLP